MKKTIDAHRIAPKLYIGSRPPERVAQHGFDMVVLCALEDIRHRDVPTLKVELIDVEEKMDRADIARAMGAAAAVNAARLRGERVLVTCQAGVNRSSFVVALALVQSGWTPSGAIERIREKRLPPNKMMPLCNRMFVNLIHVVAGRRGPQRGRA